MTMDKTPLKVHGMKVKVTTQYSFLFLLVVGAVGMVVCSHFMQPNFSNVYNTIQLLISRNGSDNLIPTQHPVKDNLVHKANSENGTFTLLRLKHHNRNILLYTALLSNDSTKSNWDRLAITGWEHRDLFNRKFVCCVRFQSGLVRRYSVKTKVRKTRVAMEGRQYICNLNGTNGDDIALETTIVPDNSTFKCPLERSKYMKVEQVYRHPGEIAIFAKIIYDKPPVADLMAWLEIHSIIGLSKALFYTFRLNENATTVLEHYRKRGKAELIPFLFPSPKYYGNKLQHAVHGLEYFNDQDVAIMDGQERLRGYKYVLAIDIDEYVVPHHNETLIVLFDRLCARHPNAAGFTFGTYLYTTTWGATSNTSQFAVGKFLNRTRLTHDCVKHFSVPDRLVTGGMSTHQIFAKKGFKHTRLSTVQAAVTAFWKDTVDNRLKRVRFRKGESVQLTAFNGYNMTD